MPALPIGGSSDIGRGPGVSGDTLKSARCAGPRGNVPPSTASCIHRIPCWHGFRLSYLHEMLGPDALFRPGQLEAIEAVARDRGRVLLVQRTGWGKCAVYFIATRLLREQGAGPTLLVSPLLALMRNQIEMAARIGVRAETINTTNPDECEPIVQRLADDQIDLLLVSPERFANERFRDEMLSVIARTVGLLVVDEAHCISDWGHDFRPDYRRIVRVLEPLPAGVPVLCTTATANDRVVADITDQLGDDAAHATAARSTARAWRSPWSTCPSQAERLAWLAETIPDARRLGHRLLLTIADAERVAAFLRRQGIEAEAYSGATDNDDRIRLEQALLANELKVLVATQRAGHGLRQARPGLRDPLPVARLAHRLLPAGRARRPRARPRAGGAAVRRRGPRHPGLLHRHGVPAAGTGRGDRVAARPTPTGRCR